MQNNIREEFRISLIRNSFFYFVRDFDQNNSKNVLSVI